MTQYICRFFSLGQLFVSPENDSLISCLGWGWGEVIGLASGALGMVGEAGWVGLSPSVWRLLFNPLLFSAVLDLTLSELASPSLGFL